MLVAYRDAPFKLRIMTDSFIHYHIALITSEFALHFLTDDDDR